MKPKLREIHTQLTTEGGQQGVLVSDSLGVSPRALFVPSSSALLLTLMDGTRDTGTLKAGFELRTGIPLSNPVIEKLVSELDEGLFLENERFSQAYKVALNDYCSAASRPPVLGGKSYPANSEKLSAFLGQYLDQVEDEGLKRPGKVRGLISPHIDYIRGGHIYARVWAKAKEAVRQAELVVILGTDHNEGEGRITLTRQNYETPWGVMPTAQDVVDELADEVGRGIFECELNHRGEHSVEAAIIWLHYLLGTSPCPVLPVLCGSFQPLIDAGKSPLTVSHIASTIKVLKRVARRRQVIIIAAADLAHVGPVFGDPSPMDFVGWATTAKQDKRLMDIMKRGQAEDFFAEILSDGNRRGICGVPPIYIALSVLSGVSGTPLGYAQCPASEDRSSLVSICGIIYQDSR